MASKGATFGKTRSQDLIDMAADKVLGEDGLPLIHPGDIKWSFDLADPDKPDQTAIEMPLAVPASKLVRADGTKITNIWELAREITKVPAGEQQPSVEPREVPGSEYARRDARLPDPHLWTRLGGACIRCQLTRELIEDYAPPCGDPVTARDALIDLMLKRNAKQAGELIQRRSVEQGRDADLAEALECMTFQFNEAIERSNGLVGVINRLTKSYELSCVARDQLRSRVRILEEDNARLKTELDRHPWARRMVR